MKYSSDIFIGYVGIVLAILGWGLSNSLIVYGLTFINPYVFLTVRFIVAILIMLPFILIFKWTRVKNLIKNKWTWIIAFFEFVGLEFQYIGQQTISAGLSTLISIQFIIFVPIIGAYFLHTPITRINVLSIVIAIIGSIFISTNGNFINLLTNVNIGIVFLLLSALSYSFYIICSSYFTSKQNNDVDSIGLFFIVILELSLFSFLPTVVYNKSVTITQSLLVVILILAVFSTIIPFIGYFKGLKVVSANTMSLVLLLQLVVPFIIDILFLGITYSFWSIVGMVLIVSSLFILTCKPFIKKFRLRLTSTNKNILITNTL